jgi:glycosyltransferase involved in cell wall biosynthesis
VRIAYLVSRFPKLSETFIADEILALERRGFEVELFALVRQRERVSHRDVEPLAERCRVASPASPGLWLAQASWLARAPRTLLDVWIRVLWEHRRSARALVRAIAVVAFASLYALRMQRSGVAHVHAHWATHPALAAWVVHRLTGLSYSFTTHADDLFVQQTMLAEKARCAAFVVAISEYNRDFLVALLGPAAPRIEVVHCGVATAELKPQPAPETGPFRIACVARLQPKKGQAELVKACAKLLRRGVEVECDLVGDGPERMALAAHIALCGLGDRVRMHGAQPRERALALVGAAHAVALPCRITATGRRDGIPVALMEAMALAKPVVATRVSGLPELIEHERSGLLVEPGDTEALVGALQRLATDPALRRRLGAEGRRRVEQEFDLDRSAQQLGELVCGVIGDLPAAAPVEQFATGEVPG